MSWSGRQPIKFALIVFVGLVVFCLAQLTWWIIFLVNQGERSKHLQLNLQSKLAEHIAAAANRDFRHIADLAGLFVEQSSNCHELRQVMETILAEPTVVGFQLHDQKSGCDIVGGIADSTFYTLIASTATVYFNVTYPTSLIGFDPEILIYRPAGRHTGETGDWVDAKMFKITPSYGEFLDAEARRQVIMFAYEGGTFVLLMLLGVYLIYRSLRRSEDLKLRQTSFVRAVTHEFHTPLTSLRLYLETLQSGIFDSRRAQEVYSKMLADCDRLGNLVDNVLQASHFGKEKYRLKLSETDVTCDLNEYLDGLEPLVRRNDGALRRDLEPEIRIRSDYQALGRAVRALVDNALRYSPPDRRNVDVTLRKRGRTAEIVVADQGVGIPASERKKVFDRFYRVGDSETRSVKGTGLGLYLVRQVVQAHGGEVSVSSNGPNEGCRFTIKIPLAR